MATQNISWVLTAQDATASAFGSVDRRLLALSGRVSDTSAAFKFAAVAAVAAGAAVVASTAEFDKWMRNVNSISHLSESAIQGVSDKVLDLARNLPMKGAASDLARGLYDIASSGFYGAEGLTILAESAKAASAGLTSTQNSAKAIVGVLNAYGLQAKDSADVSDTLFQTVNLGIVTFGELAQQLGDVIGLSAAAKVPIDDVGAAIAAITLAGIPAAEAFTSLNQLFRKLLDPSSALAAMYQRLGINITQDLANPAIGLFGVMEQLRGATGGNVEALIQLFPQIRAARGAFALMANDGQNYARTMDGIANETNRANATQKAYDEQMKSLSAQWGVLINQVQVGAIELGRRWLPTLIEVAGGTGELLTAAGRLSVEIGQRLHPFFVALGQVTENLSRLISGVADAVGPLVAGFAALVGTGAIGALNGLAEGLSAVTGFLADHPGLVQAVAVAYGVTLVAQLARAAAAFAALKVIELGYLLVGLKNIVLQAVQSFGLLQLALGGVVLAAGIGGLIALGNAVQSANSQVKELSASFREGLDMKSVDGVAMAVDRAKAKLSELDASGKASGGFGNYFKGVVELLTPLPNTIYDAGRAYQATQKDLEKFAQLQVHLSENSSAVAKATGYSTQSVEYFARALGIDLTGGFKQSEPARQKLIDHMGSLTTVVYGAGRGVQDLGQIMPEELEEMAKATDKFLGKVSETFYKDFDIIGRYGDAVKSQAGASKELTDAQSKLTKETSDLQQVRQRLSVDTKISVSDQQGLANALKSVADAQAEVNEKSAALKASDPSTIFAQMKREAQEFVTNIQGAAEKGLNASFIVQLMQAGPKAAAPILQAIAADHSGNLIGLINDTQKTLATINNAVVEAARVTNLAINTKSIDMARDFDSAMEILRIKAAHGGKVTAEQLANEMGIGVDRVKQITKDYVIDVDEKTAEADRLASWNSSETHRHIVENFTRAKEESMAKMDELAVAVGANLNVAAISAKKGSGQMADDWIKEVNRGADTTGKRLKDWTDEVPSVFNAMVSKLISPDALARAKQDTGNILKGFGAAAGGYLPKEAKFQSPGTLVQWAEPSTSGEFFFPKSKGEKNIPLARQMLALWGYGVVKQSYAEGGMRGLDEYGIPMPPDYGTYITSAQADLVSRSKYAELRELFRTIQGNPALGGSSNTPSGPVPSGAVMDWVRAGIALASKPMSWADPEGRIAMFESGGNPHAINLWDWNAEQGHPSKGLMQMIDSTFEAYKVAGHNDIWNPIDNVASASRYIASRYGDPWHTPGELSLARGGPYQGYALGGFHAAFDGGGVLPPGGWGFNGSNLPEMVLDGALSDFIREAAAVHASGSNDGLYETVAAAVADAVREAMGSVEAPNVYMDGEKVSKKVASHLKDLRTARS